MSKIALEAENTGESCKHEWIADLSSLTAVILLFGSVFGIMFYHDQTLEWLTGDSMLTTILGYGFILLDAVLIVSLLCFGPNCHSNNQSCFGTFKGRKHWLRSGQNF